jgi:serine/threonine-protein kinase
MIGRTLNGRYDVLAQLGAGVAGVVYEGRQAQLDRLVAIKVLQQSAAASPAWRRGFESDARVLSALAHPNIVRITDFGIDGDVPYLVTELLQGKTLADLIDEGPVSPARALDIVGQMLRGLAFAHRQGIGHGGLKPTNVFLQALPDHADRVRLLDFGMARFLDGASPPTPYTSPEQEMAERVDTRADIYAAGAILFHLLAGRPPDQPVPSLAEARPELSIARLVQPVIDRAMAKKPADRYPQALWMLSALDALTGESTAAAARADLAPAVEEVPAVSAEPAREPRARPGRTAIVLIGLAAAVAAGVIFLRGHRGALFDSVTPVAAQAPAPSAETTSPPAPTQAAAPPPAPPVSATAPEKRARDPWQEPVPEALAPIRDSLERGERLGAGALGPAYAFARKNPDDPRPWLLVGRAFAQINWLKDSVERYQRAYRADPTCRGDPHMLEDLLKAAAHKAAGRDGARAIRDIYGAEALPAVEKAIARVAADPDAAERLDHLRDSLAE